MIDVRRLVYTRHAQAAMAARGVTPDDVELAITDPHVTEPNGDARRYVRGDLVAVVAGTNFRPVLVTVLLRARHQWTSEEMRRRRPGNA